jgi:hypothetical protein
LGPEETLVIPLVPTTDDSPRPRGAAFAIFRADSSIKERGKKGAISKDVRFDDPNIAIQNWWR